MRLLVAWAKGDPEIEIFFREIEKAGHEVVYWVGERAAEQYAPKGATFHDHYDAWDGKPAKTLRDMLTDPPSEALVESMYRTESISLTMMDKRYDSAPVDERKQIYYSMLSYWSAVLDRAKPDCIIFGIVPHSVYNFILHELAVARGVQVISFEDVWFLARVIPFRNFWDGSEEVRRAVEKNLDRRITADDLGPEIRTWWDRFKKHGLQVPPYMLHQREIAEGWGLWRHRAKIAARTFGSRLVRVTADYTLRLFEKNLKDEYNEVVQQVNLNKPFVYFPLSFQPERTTSPQGGIYHDQILAAKTLSAALPHGWIIYTKEHPSQRWLRTKVRYSSARFPGYYRRLVSIPNVVLVPPETNSFELIKHTKAIAVVTGTAGWESLLTGKPPLVFGIPWYRDCPGIIHVRSTEDCRRAFARIEAGEKVAEAQMLAYLKALEETSVRAYLEDHSKDGGPDIPITESMRVMANDVIQRLQRISPR